MSERQLLSDTSHEPRRRDDDDEVVIKRDRVPDAAKLTAADVADVRPSLLASASPGKLTRTDVDRNAMSPATALRYASSLSQPPRIDRRAESGGADPDDLGTLSTAFSFIEQVQDATHLPAELAARLSAELGVDVSGVRIHTDERAARAAAAIGARAFTIGQDIYFGANAYDPTGADGIELIAHEVAHAAENRKGGSSSASRRVSRPEDAHEQQADEFARQFARRQTRTFDTSDPAQLVDKVRAEGARMQIPFLDEIQRELGAPLDHVEAYTGEAARVACQLMSAGAFAVRNIVAFADPSPQRETLMHELTHIVQMGGRSTMAPIQFRIGSLRVGSEDSAAEHEAHAAESGQGHAHVAADPDVIHRKTTDPWNLEEAKARCKTFLDGLERCDPKEPVFGHKTKKDYRYKTTSKSYFMREEYISKALKGVNISQNAKEEELQKLYAECAKDLGLVKLGGGSKWAWVFPGNPQWDKEVKYIADRIYDEASVTDKWKVYLDILNKPTIKKHSIKPKSVKLEEDTETDEDPAPALIKFKQGGRVPTSETELGKCRDNLEDAFVANQKWHWNGGDAPHDTAWEQFYADVVKPPGGAVFTGGYAQMQGTIFGRIATEDMNKPGLEGGINRQETFFSDAKKKRFKKNTQTYKLNADGFQLVGDTIKVIDFKSGGEPGGPDGDMMRAAHDYNVIATKKGVKVENIAAVTEDDAKIKHVLYVFPTKDLANKWAPALKQQIPGEGVLQIVPKVDDDDIGTVQMPMNPTFEVSLKNKTATSHRIPSPPIAHHGISIQQVTINTKAAGSSEVTGGEVIFDVDMGGAMKADGVKKKLTPEGGNKARIENKLPGLQGELSKLLKGAEVEAKVTDAGVEGSLKVKGSTKIGVIEVTEGDVNVKYGEAGLSVTGGVGLSYRNGQIKGRLEVGWASGAWTFNGTVDFPENMVDGLSAFQASVSYGGGKWVFGVNRIAYTRKIKAITLTGSASGVKFDVDKGHFSGLLQLEADLGMFGKASGRAELEKNKLTKAELSYDSPELKYPSKKDPPTFTGTIGGTLKYENEQFSGDIRGTANLNVPALKKIAGDAGVGLAVDAHIKSDGGYSGTIALTTPLKFGKHLEIPSISCTIKDDGSVEGDFSIKIKEIKYLKDASIECKIDKDGFKVTKADVHAEFGKEGDKMWGGIAVTYEEGKGIKIAGTLNVKIKEGMIAKGTIEYSTETNKLSAKLGIDEITLFDKSMKKNLFAFSKQIPLVSFYNIIGIYLDIGFDLDFEFDMKLGLKPTVELEGLSLDTFEYSKMAAEIELLGQLRAALVATPKVGLGIFAISPSLLRGGGGIKIPITGEALLKPTGKLKVSYSPSGGVEGEASVGMQLTFGIKGSVKPYAEAAILDGAWNPSWTGDSLADFEILPPKELMNFTLDLAGDMSKSDGPTIPSGPQAPSAPGGGKQIAQEAPKKSEAGGTGPGKDATPPTSGPAGGEAADDSVFQMGSLTGMLKGLPGYGTISGFMEKAAKVWEKIKGFFGRVAKAFKSFFESIGNAIEEVLNGFASEGIGYLPKLIKKIVGDSVWNVIEPIVNAVASSADAILELFETDPPKGVADFFPWALKLMKKAFGVAFDSISNLVSAIRTMMGRLADLAVKVVTQMVNDGMIGVRRYCYYIWKPIGKNWYFLAATEYKIKVLGSNIYFKEDGMITSPGSVVGVALFEVLEAMGVPATSSSYNSDAEDTYRDRWV